MHHHHHVDIEGGERQRFDLPLGEHPLLDLGTDFALLSVKPVAAGETPFLEVVGGVPLPEVTIVAERGTTSVRIDYIGRNFDERLRRRGFWDGNFWDRRRWKKNFQAHVIVHVPENVRARLRPIAASVHVEKLLDCEIDIQTEAAALVLNDVSGRIVLGTEMGRIDGTGLAGSLSVTTTAGAVRLEIRSLDPGKHRVRTSMGAAIIEVARGMPVQIDTRTTMGSSRVEATSTRGAGAILDVEADLGAIRVLESRHAWIAPEVARSRPSAQSPYRSAPPDDDSVEKILSRVAEGSLAPRDARELLRSMGWT